MNIKAKFSLTALFILVLGSGLYVFEKKNVQSNLSQRQSHKFSLHDTRNKSPNLIPERKKKMKGLTKPEHPDRFAKYHLGIRTRHGEAAPSYPQNYRIQELLKARSLKNTKGLSKVSATQKLNWLERGPGNVSGRTRGLIVDPDDATFNTWYAGSVGGGIWKTENSGQTWRELTSNLPNLSTSTLGMSPANTDIIYVGTGEGFGFFGFVYGNGIWKSTDRGETWEQLESTANNPEFRNIMRIIVDPNNANILLVAAAPGFRAPDGQTKSGIFRSVDGGVSWTKVYESAANDVQQIVANPQSFNTQYATVNSEGVLKSIDGGQTWAESSTGINNSGGPKSVLRIELAIAPSDTSTLYISAESEASGAILYRSPDGGANWFVGKELNGNDVNWLGNQGWYDNAIAVNPFNENELFVGGINIWEMTVDGDIETIGPTVTSVIFENTKSFIRFHDFNGQDVASGISLGTANLSDFTSIEFRFGPGKSQKAHRFLVPQGATSGVPAQDYTYQDYVEVPFEVWDIDNNMQLMVSFRDQTRNGEFELTLFDGQITREYIFPQAVPYSSSLSSSIAVSGGHTFKQLYFMWPELAPGADWDPDNLPSAVLRINWGEIIVNNMTVQQVTNWFPGLSNPDGGNFPFVHADQHNLTLIPTDATNGLFRILNANDGGVEFSDNNGLTWSKTLNGYNTTQFYGIDKMNGSDRYIGGTQDNGTWVSPANPDAASSWQDAPSGDGFEAVWHYGDSDKLLESSQFNNIFRSLDGGVTWRSASSNNGLDNVGENTAPFFTKIARSKQDPDLIFAVGSSGVWRSENFATHWTLTDVPAGFKGNSPFTEIKISLSNPQIVWTAGEMSSEGSPYVSTDGGLSFNPTNVFDQTLGVVSGFETHPTDDSTAYALFSFSNAPKVLRTTDLGQTWEDISGFGTGATSTNGFPDVATYSLLVMPFDTNRIWVGTEIGIFESLDNGQTWAFADNGFPAAAVFDMVIVNDEIVVGTHGRGVWSVSLAELAGYEPPPAILAPRFNSVEGGTIISADLALKSAYDSTHVLVDGVKSVSLGANETAIDTLIPVPVVVDRIQFVNVSLISFKDEVLFKNAETRVIALPLNEVQSGFVFDFNSRSNDLFFLGLELDIPPGFNNGALQSPHDYPDNDTLIAILSIPIHVAQTDAILKYEDVAIIEPGATGSQFGDSDFSDYVMVEGSRDRGFSWRPLADGYDARFSANWLNAYNQDQPGSPTMFEAHEINLLDVFSPGDEILIRFRLFADANESGWGWALDNLSIQEDAVSVEQFEAVPKIFSLSQNYPNPFNPNTQINYTLPRSSKVSLKIFNVLGQEIRRLVKNEQQLAKAYSVEWDGKDESGVVVSSGVYFYRIQAEDVSGNVFIESRKMMFLK